MGSSRVHTPITRTMFGSFSIDMTFISRWKSDLKSTREIDGYSNVKHNDSVIYEFTIIRVRREDDGGVVFYDSR